MKYIDFEAHYFPISLKKSLCERTTAPFYTKNKIMFFGQDCSLPYGEIENKLLDVSETRIQTMNEAGIDIQIISSVGGIELLPSEEGILVAKEANDILYKAIQANSNRLKGYAVLAPHNVDVAIDELERCVCELGFVAWNAFSNFGEDALDNPKYFPLLEKAQELGIFIYLHPTMPNIDRLHGLGRQLVASGLGFGVDVMITLTRMILLGVFDKLPDLKIVLGHLGEGFPFVMDRMRSRGTQQGKLPAINLKDARDYFATNIWVSTSGNYSAAAFRCAQEMLGTDHILFGSDYPMENLSKSVNFLHDVSKNTDVEEMIAYKNAENFFGIK